MTNPKRARKGFVPFALSDRPQTCGLRARFPDCLSTHRFACFDGQQSGRECIFPFRTALRFACAVFRHCGRPLGVSSRLQPLRGLRLRTTLRSVCSALQPFGPSPFCKHLHPQFAIVDLHRSQARLQLSLLTGRTTRCFAHRARASCAPQKMPEMTYTPSFLIRASFFEALSIL